MFRHDSHKTGRASAKPQVRTKLLLGTWNASSETVKLGKVLKVAVFRNLMPLSSRLSCLSLDLERKYGANQKWG
eukprot:2132620-Amphidinium_carterae.1